MTLARGLVWCKSCQVRTALSDAGGKCPVCDPDQGNRVSKNAETELERIDAVLAGADSRWEGAEWRADGSHEDDELLPWQAAFMHRRIVSGPLSRHALGRGRSLPVGTDVQSQIGPGAEWVDIGVLTDDILFGFDSSRDDDAITFGPIQMLTMTVRIIPVTHGFSDALLRVLFGPGWYYSEREALNRWEDDGGPIVAADDV